MFHWQVDECGLPVPRTLARMAAERGVRLIFGPKRGQWRIEVDWAAEKRITRAASNLKAHGSIRVGHSSSRKMHNQRAASMHALSVIRSVRTMRMQDPENTQARPVSSDFSSKAQTPSLSEPGFPPENSIALDPARLALPRSGYKRIDLRDVLATIQPIDEASASDQVLA